MLERTKNDDHICYTSINSRSEIAVLAHIEKLFEEVKESVPKYRLYFSYKSEHTLLTLINPAFVKRKLGL